MTNKALKKSFMIAVRCINLKCNKLFVWISFSSSSGLKKLNQFSNPEYCLIISRNVNYWNKLPKDVVFARSLIVGTIIQGCCLLGRNSNFKKFNNSVNEIIQRYIILNPILEISFDYFSFTGCCWRLAICIFISK